MEGGAYHDVSENRAERSTSTITREGIVFCPPRRKRHSKNADSSRDIGGCTKPLQTSKYVKADFILDEWQDSGYDGQPN